MTAQQQQHDSRRRTRLDSIEQRLGDIAGRVQSGQVAHAWSDLHALDVSWGSADENWGEAVLSLLAHHWDQVPELFAIQQRDDEFFRFVLDRLDGPYDSARGRLTEQNAVTRCPTGGSTLCARIREAAERAGKNRGPDR